MKTIYIGAGHSNADSGAIGFLQGRKITEAEIVTELRNLIANEFRRQGVAFIADGEDDKNLTLSESIALAQTANGLRVELHCNAHKNSHANGTECVGIAQHQIIAQEIALCVARVLGTRLRGTHGFITESKTARKRLAFVSVGNGLILELFFISNADDLARYQANKYALAKELANTIQRINSEIQ